MDHPLLTGHTPQYALCRNRENTEKCKIFLSKVHFPITRRLLQWLLKKNVAIIKCTLIDNKNVSLKVNIIFIQRPIHFNENMHMIK